MYFLDFEFSVSWSNCERFFGMIFGISSGFWSGFGDFIGFTIVVWFWKISCAENFCVRVGQILVIFSMSHCFWIFEFLLCFNSVYFSSFCNFVNFGTRSVDFGHFWSLFWHFEIFVDFGILTSINRYWIFGFVNFVILVILGRFLVSLSGFCQVLSAFSVLDFVKLYYEGIISGL